MCDVPMRIDFDSITANEHASPLTLCHPRISLLGLGSFYVCQTYRNRKHQGCCFECSTYLRLYKQVLKQHSTSKDHDHGRSAVHSQQSLLPSRAFL